MDRGGFGMLQAVMAMGLLSLGVLTFYSSLSQMGQARVNETLSTSGQFLFYEIGRTMSDQSVCPQNLGGQRLLPNGSFELNEIKTRTGATLVSTSDGSTYYGGLKVKKIEVREKQRISPSEARVQMITTINFKGKERQGIVEGFVDLSGNQITSCRMMGTNQATVEDVCKGIKGASFNAGSGMCEIGVAGSYYATPERGGTSDAWRTEKNHITACPEGTGAVGIEVNGFDTEYFVSVRLICQNIGLSGTPAGAAFLAPEQTGPTFHGSGAFGDRVACGGNQWVIGYDLDARVQNVVYGSGVTGVNHVFKFVTLVCGNKDHTSVVRSSRSRSPNPSYPNSGGYGAAAKQYTDLCSSDTILRQIRAGHNNGGSGPNSNYIHSWQGFCS